MKQLIQKMQQEKGNLFSIFSTTILSTLASFAMTLAFANLIEPSTLGTYQYIIAIASVVGAFSLTGIPASIIRALGKKEFAFLPVARKYIYLGSIPGILVGVGVGFYYVLVGNMQLGISIALSSFFYLTMLTMYRYNAFYLAINKVKEANLLLKTYALAPVAIVLPALFFIKDPHVLAVLYFLSVCLAFIVSAHILGMRRQEQLLVSQESSLVLSATRIKELLRFGLNQSIIYLLNATSAHLDKVIIFQLLGAQATAIYFIAVSLPNRFRSLIKSYDSFLFARFSKHSPDAVKKQMLPRFLFTILAILPLYSIYVLGAPLLFTLFFPAYTEAVILSQIYAITLFAGALIIPQSLLKAHANDSMLYSNSFILIAVRSGLVTAGALYYGLTGAIIGATLSLIIYTLLTLFQAIIVKSD